MKSAMQNRLIKFARLEAHCVRRSDLHRDCVPLVHPHVEHLAALFGLSAPKSSVSDYTFAMASGV
jgi:hypothetical protein